MKLGIQMLDGDSTVNNLKYINQVEINPGETATVMFQIVDMTNKDMKGQSVRYMPQAGATMTARMVSVNSANTLSKIPLQPFAADGSIWSFAMSIADTTKAAGVNLEVVLTEGASVKRIWAQSVVIFGPQSPFRG
jgi:hypothetical protein